MQLTVVGSGIFRNDKYAYPEEIKDLTLLSLTQSTKEKLKKSSVHILTQHEAAKFWSMYWKEDKPNIEVFLLKPDNKPQFLCFTI